jgi:hypothetical protein
MALFARCDGYEELFALIVVGDAHPAPTTVNGRAQRIHHLTFLI